MVYKVKFILSMALLISSITKAQVTKEYDFKDFTKIDISSAFEAIITQGAEYKISISIDESMVDHLEIESEDNELEIGMKSWKSNTKFRPKAEVQLPNLSDLEVSGASTVEVINIESSNLTIEVSGASVVKGNLQSHKLKLEASGASKIVIEGLVNKMEVYLSGASQLGAEELETTDELIFDASGASQANCLVNGDMYLKLEGASHLSYIGQGDVVKQEVSGASVVEKK